MTCWKVPSSPKTMLATQSHTSIEVKTVWSLLDLITWGTGRSGVWWQRQRSWVIVDTCTWVIMYIWSDVGDDVDDVDVDDDDDDK